MRDPMRANEQVEKLILSANRIAKQEAMLRRLTEIECRLHQAIALNSRTPCLSDSHAVWQDLNLAIERVRFAIVRVATQRV
jgi:hypothetical protein